MESVMPKPCRSHPLRVLSPLEGIILRYRTSQADSFDSFAT